jgi:hypothetical protein
MAAETMDEEETLTGARRQLTTRHQDGFIGLAVKHEYLIHNHLMY